MIRPGRLAGIGLLILSAWVAGRAGLPGIPPAGADGAPSPATAEPEVRGTGLELTLRGTVIAALDGNLELAARRLDPARAAEEVVAARAAFDPLLTASARTADTRSPTGTTLAGAVRLEDEQTDVAAGIAQRIPAGTEFSVRALQQRIDTNSAFATLTPRYEPVVTFRVDQPLLRGGWDVAGIPIRIARIDRRIAESAYAQAVAEMVEAVEARYWRLVAAGETEAARAASLDRARELLETNRARAAAGQIAANEVLVAEAEVAVREEALLVARNETADEADRLRAMLDPESLGGWDRPLRPIDIPPESPDDALPTPPDAVADALDRRPELRQSTLRDGRLAAREREARDALLPRLDGYGEFGRRGLDGNSGNAFDDLGAREHRTWELGIEFEFPIGNRAARARLRQSEIDRSREEYLRRDLAIRIAVEVREALRQTETDRKRIDAAATGLRAAERKLTGERARFDNGLSTTHQLLEFQEDVAEQTERWTRARTDYQTSLTRLARVRGRLLETREITIE